MIYDRLVGVTALTGGPINGGRCNSPGQPRLELVQFRHTCKRSLGGSIICAPARAACVRVCVCVCALWIKSGAGANKLPSLSMLPAGLLASSLGSHGLVWHVLVRALSEPTTLMACSVLTKLNGPQTSAASIGRSSGGFVCPLAAAEPCFCLLFRHTSHGWLATTSN